MCMREDESEKGTIMSMVARERKIGVKREGESKREKEVGVQREGEIKREESERDEEASQMLASARRWNVFKTKEELI